MPTLEVRTPEGVDLHLSLAGAGSRTAAGLIDLAILLTVFLSLFVAFLVVAQLDPTGATDFALGLLFGGGVLAMVVYQAVLPVFLGGRTPGKAVLDLRVVTAHGDPAGPLAHVLRGLVWLIDFFLMFPLPLGVVLIASTPRRQRLGDLVASTIVVHESAHRAPPEPWPNLVWSSLVQRTVPLVPALAARLTHEDLEFLRALLTRDGMHEAERRRLYVDTARHYAARLDLGAFDDARDFLQELYLFARETLRA